ncbi:MAG: hypothetical protein AAGH89_03900, partial [Verrucomicrobiota bacterium]
LRWLLGSRTTFGQLKRLADDFFQGVVHHVVVEMFDGYLEQNHPIKRPKRYKKKKQLPKSYDLTKPRAPWSLDPESGGPNPDFRNPRVSYEDYLKRFLN